MRLYIDIESRSPVDLLKCGTFAYAESPLTQVILMSWAIDDDPIQTWYILQREPIPLMLRLALRDPRVTLVAHNAAGFERPMFIMRGRDFLPLDCWEAMKPLERWDCTAARASACGLPRALDKVAMALGLRHQKDKDGYGLMLRMCKPRGQDQDGRYRYIDDIGSQRRLGTYCEEDVAVEREVDARLPQLSPFERDVWIATEKMNQRGIQIDRALLNKMVPFTLDATLHINERLDRLTSGQVKKVTNPAAIKTWLLNYGIDCEDTGIGKWIINGLLEDDSIPEIVREVLILRRDGGKSSTAKFKSIEGRVNSDDRVRGSILYAGASQTLRFSSRGTQLQNLPRSGKIKDIDGAISAVMNNATASDIEHRFGAPMIVASELIRPVFVAPEGYWMARGDYSQIEDRSNAYLAGQKDTIEAFRRYDRKEGPDLYIVAASQIYGVAPESIDKEDPRRQVGKVIRLACGYGGGVGAFQSMARIYNVKVSDEQAETAKNAWREANPFIKSFWYELDSCAIECMRSPPGRGVPVRSGISFRRTSECLGMRLPSGHTIVYWYPRLEKVTTPWGAERDGITYYAEDSQKHIWARFQMWYGIFCENACQAYARDIMAHAIVLAERQGLNPVLTVHDEMVCELPKSQYPTAKDAADKVKQVMLQVPPWAAGLPLAADASAGPRYVKA